MPTLDVAYDEFEKMLGIRLEKNIEKINEILAFAKGEVKFFDEKEALMSIEIKDSNRPDLWGLEGLARALRGFLGLEKGLKKYVIGEPVINVHVDPQLRNIRPYIGCAVVKNVKLSDALIRGLMHTQDKLDQTYGRNRQKTSIGLYNFDLINPPLHYTVSKPTEYSFTPLGLSESMTLKEILEKHPKGMEYGHIVKKHPVYPILLDSKKNVLSFPPIINSNDLGRVTEDTKNVLVEVTGTVHENVVKTLTIVTLSLIDHGGKAYSALIHYPHENLKDITPTFKKQFMKLDADYVNGVLGLKITAREIAKLLSKAGFDTEQLEGSELKVQIPPYRVDIMHPIDLVEDVAIAYGYNNIKPLWREMPVRGRLSPSQGFVKLTRELMVGLGFQEILTYTLSNPEKLFTKMNCRKERIIEIANPKVQTLTCLRNWLLPGLMEFLSNNLHVEYPQKIFELSTVTVVDEECETRTRDEMRLAAVITHACASFSEIKSALNALLMNLGIQWKIKENKHPSFIDGRVGAVINGNHPIGIVGEIHPKVLTAWNLENPAAAFELNVEKIIKLMQLK